MPGLITDEILDELRHVRREVREMAETQQDIKAKLDALETTVRNLEAAQDMTTIGNRIDAVGTRLQALIPSPETTPLADGSPPAIDPNTGQPVQPV